MKIKLITIGMVSLLGLGACNSSSFNAEKAGVETFSSTGGSYEAVATDDAAKLRSDISALFGDADSKPVAVEDGDTVQDVLNRL